MRLSSAGDRSIVTNPLFLFTSLLSDMAQNMFSMSRVRNDTEHENIQRFQQTSILRSVSIYPLTYEAVNIAIYGPNKLRQCGSTNVGKKRHHIKVEAINANPSSQFHMMIIDKLKCVRRYLECRWDTAGFPRSLMNDSDE